jgi:hypothetical protein
MPKKKHTKESARQKNAFESFLRHIQTNNTTGAIKKVAEEFNVTDSGVWGWYCKYNWKTRAQKRNQHITETLKQHNLNDILQFRTQALQITNSLIKNLNKPNRLQLKNIKDLEILVRLQLLLLEQPTEIQEHLVHDRDERLKRLQRIGDE